MINYSEAIQNIRNSRRGAAAKADAEMDCRAVKRIHDSGFLTAGAANVMLDKIVARLKKG